MSVELQKEDALQWKQIGIQTHQLFGLTILNLRRFAPLTDEYPASASEIINL